MQSDSLDDNGKNEILCDSKVIIESRSETLAPSGNNGPFIVNVPVVFSKNKVTIDIESIINFPECAIDIIHDKKSIYITKCKFCDLGNKKYGKINLSGFVKKSVEYACADLSENTNPTGKMRFISVRIPFECAAKIEYYQPPVLKGKSGFIPVLLNQGNSLIYEDKSPGTYAKEAYDSVGSIFCDLQEVLIDEYGTERGLSKFKNSLEENDLFDVLTQNITISITFVLMQNQLINLPKY